MIFLFYTIFLFYSGSFACAPEKLLRQLKSQHDSQHNCRCAFYSFIACRQRLIHLIHHKIIGSPVNSGSWHQREDSRQHKNQNRALPAHGEKTSQQRDSKGCQAGGGRSPRPLHAAPVYKPPGASRRSAPDIAAAGHSIQHRKGRRSHESGQQFSYHRKIPPSI